MLTTFPASHSSLLLPRKMETLIYNARVYLKRDEFTEAVLIRDDRIAAVGDNSAIRSLASSGARRLDAEGGLLLPGFYDCHVHFGHLGAHARMIDLGGVPSLDELVARCRQKLEELGGGEVVSGGGYNQEHFSGEKRFPTRFDLDQVSSRTALVISRCCGHVVSCNTRALELAGIYRPESFRRGKAAAFGPGLIEIGEDGVPTGVFREGATALIRDLVSVPRGPQKRADLEHALREALSFGVTAAATYDTNGFDFDETLETYTDIVNHGGPRLRLALQCGILRNPARLAFYQKRGLKTGQFLLEPWIKMGPLKLFADGSLGSRTAWLSQPYHDDPRTSGIPAMDAATLHGLFHQAGAAGLQIVIHAIGDAALDAVLTGFERITAPGKNPLRHGALHCQITGRSQLERMRRNHILALVQPCFLREDHRIVQSRVGETLASTSYAWGTMHRLGIPTAYGTDCPVEPVNPLLGIASAVGREGGFYPEECVDVSTAVDAYTQGSAYANFDETRLGRIKPGFLADLVLLDRDIFVLPPEQIPSARVRWTMTGGETGYMA